ncbi:MAG: SGNH/GDSL hydrolase family protein [Alphaproteobacteria bacterium]|nr:SGNH/GDSL hydrolase family protein [Alphaproteobacteria bacterium]
MADALAAELGEPVVNLAVPGAAIRHPDPGMAAEGLDIRAQYCPQDWAWVVVEGGANDLNAARERGCDTVLDSLVSADGRQGDIADLVRRIRADGARVVALGYYQLSDALEDRGFCGDALSVLSDRIETMAALDPGVVFVSMAEVVPSADPASYDRDGVHPSARSSEAIGQAIARAIRSAEGR